MPRTTALIASAVLHLIVLALFYVPAGGPGAAAPPVDQRPVRLVAEVVWTQSPAAGTADPRPEHAGPAGPREAGAGLLIVLDDESFGDLFHAARVWKAHLRTGVVIPDPAVLNVFIAHPERWQELAGNYNEGDDVVFEFPLSFKQHIITAALRFQRARRIAGPLHWVRVQFSSSVKSGVLVADAG